MLASLLLQRCQSLPVDAAKFTAAHDLCVAATENAQQCDQSWLRFAEIWLPRCNASFDNPGFVFVDGHSSHVTRAFIEMCAKYSICVIVEPSHTSIVLQVADMGINRFLKETYEREYKSGICTASLTGQKFDDVEKIGCVVRTIHALRSENTLIARCFEKCGLFSGYNDVSSHFPSRLFNAGSSLRDCNFTRMNPTYFKSVLSVSNLAAQRGAAVEIPETIMSERQKRLEDYARLAAGFRKFYFALGATAEVQDEDDGNSSVEPICARDVVSDGVRRLFKLRKALNVPRGAPGRLSTAFGSLASAVDRMQPLLQKRKLHELLCYVSLKETRKQKRKKMNCLLSLRLLQVATCSMVLD